MHAQVAAGDNRIGAILLLFAPVVGWVSVQLACLTGCTRSVGLYSSCRHLLHLDRLGLRLTLGLDLTMTQVLFNIGGPALNQLNDTAAKSKDTQKNKDQGRKRGVAAGLGLTAGSMLAAQNADAAEALVEAAQKVNDNRIGIIATVFVVGTVVLRYCSAFPVG